MYKKTMTYEDFDGNIRTEDFYFHLTEAEIIELNFGQFGGFEKTVEKIIAEQDMGRLIEIFKELVLKAYGEKSLDGKRFMKSDEIAKAFSETQAYSDLFMDLATNSDSATEFVNEVVPKKIKAQLIDTENSNVKAVAKN